MTKPIIYIIAFILLNFTFIDTEAANLTYEGKVSAQITRDVSVPYPILVDQVFVKIGDTVKKDQRLLQYSIEEKHSRGMQNELLNAGGQADYKVQKSSLEQELRNLNTKRKIASELTAKGMGSKEENAVNSLAYSNLQQRIQAHKQRENASQIDFGIRLRELEGYFGQKLKAGQLLPKEFFMIAPMDGTIISMSAQARVGGLLSGSAFTLAVLNPIQAQILVHESEISKLHVNQNVTVELASNNKIKLNGKIVMLSWQPNDPTIAVPSFYYVWIDIENPNNELKPGYKVLIHVTTDDN